MATADPRTYYPLQFECIMPEQLQSDPSWTPEQNLLYAMLVDAITCYQRKTTRTRERRWFTSRREDGQECFTFNDICTALDMNAENIRALVLEMPLASSRFIGPNRRPFILTILRRQESLTAYVALKSDPTHRISLQNFTTRAAARTAGHEYGERWASGNRDVPPPVDDEYLDERSLTKRVRINGYERSTTNGSQSYVPTNVD